jgi:multiple sugar transport system substrate-binding protein
LKDNDTLTMSPVPQGTVLLTRRAGDGGCCDSVTMRGTTTMTTLSRRKLVGGGAAAAGAMAVNRVTAGAAPVFLRGNVDRATQADGRQEVLFYHIWGTPPGGTPAAAPAPMSQLIAAFNEQSTTTFINDQTPGNYNETLQKTQADLAAGNPPDIVATPWAFLNFAVEGLGIRNLADIAGDQMATLQGMVAESAWPLVDYNGEIKGLPYGLSTPIFYYNADVFESAGVDPVAAFATWESLAEALPAISDALGGNPPFSISYNKDWATQTIVQSNGGRILNDDGTFGFASDEAKAALQTIADIDAAGFYDRGTREELRPNFIAGSTAIMQMSVASLGGVRNDATFNFGTSAFPRFGDQTRMASGGSFLGVYSNKEERYEGITEFFTFAVGEVGYPIWNQVGYVNVSTLDVPRLEGQDPAYEQFEEGLARETNWPGSRGLEIQMMWEQTVTRMFAGDIDVEAGVSEALEQANRLAN